MLFVQIIDSVPLPVQALCQSFQDVALFPEKLPFSVCESKKEKVYGFKMILQHHLEGFLYRFLLAAANHHDVKLAGT